MRNRSTSEEVVIAETFASVAYFWLSNPTAFLSTLFFGAGLIYAYVKSRQWKITLTTRRIEIRYGLFSHRQDIIDLNKIKHLSYYQSLVGRWLDFGEITLQTTYRQPRIFTIPMNSPRLWVEAIRRGSCGEIGDAFSFVRRDNRALSVER